jgi:arylsulfatase A-like enzyme
VVPEPPQREASRATAGAVIVLALWAGLVTGYGEVTEFGVRLLRGLYAERSRDAVWLVPTFYATLFLVVGLVIIPVARLARLSWQTVAAFFAGLGTFLLLLLFPWLHWLASIVLAVGVGASIARLSTDWMPMVKRFVHRTLPWLALSVCVVAVTTFGWRAFPEHQLLASRPPAAQGAPNVLLLILDTVRAANLSLYGFARRTSPELEHFAQGGTTFERAFSAASWTTPSHAAMFTGQWPANLNVTWRDPLGSRWPTLAEVLRAHGYATAGFVANELYAGWTSGLMRGFEHYDDYPLSLWSAVKGTTVFEVIYPPVRDVVEPHLGGLPLLWRLKLPVTSRHRSADRINRAFLDWLDQTRPEPFFAFLNFMDAHGPYTTSESFRDRYREPGMRGLSEAEWKRERRRPVSHAKAWPRQAFYDGSIAYLDSQLGELFRELDRRHLLENTLIIVTADHGEEFAEHGLMDHGNSLYRLSVHVPLVIRFSGHVPAGRRVTAAVSLRNLAATVLELVKVDGSALPGRSLTRFWSGGDATPDTIVNGIVKVDNQPAWFPASQGNLNSVAFDGWRYIQNEGTGAEELFDFEHDILERWNLIGSAKADSLLPRYRAALAALKEPTSEPRLARR